MPSKVGKALHLVSKDGNSLLATVESGANTAIYMKTILWHSRILPLLSSETIMPKQRLEKSLVALFFR